VIRADGSGLRRLTPRGTTVYSYAWSPDGRLIAYTDQRLSLWLVRPDGTGRTLLLPSSKVSTVGLSWSPDGERIAIIAAGPNAKPQTLWCSKLGLYVVPIGGGSPRSLTGNRVGCDVDWSPRGDEIAYSATGPDRGGTRAIHPDGTGDRRITSKASGGQWSADGAQLAFNVAIHPRAGITDRYRAFAVVNANGTGYHLVTTHAYNEYGEAWSPHGHQILYGRADRKGIYLIGPDGRNNHRVTHDSPPQAGWGAFAWSPNGGSIVYTAGDTDNTDLYVIGIDGRGKAQLTNTPDIDISPSWADLCQHSSGPA
jgi:Tol biopolymer transport system component